VRVRGECEQVREYECVRVSGECVRVRESECDYVFVVCLYECVWVREYE